MCYSAMVEQDAKTLERQFGAKIQIEQYAELFKRRLQGEKLYINKAMELPFLKDPKSMEERAIGKTIREWQENEIKRLTEERDKQTTRLQKAVESLKKKETKKALEDQRIATNKISKCDYDLKKLKAEKLESDSDSRIFPRHYVSVLCLDEQGNKVIRPMRYLMRPHDEDESFDNTHDGCYNARFDNLTRVKFWRDSLENRRGIILVKKFYENVPLSNYPDHKKLPAELREKENIVVCFEPKGVDYMLIPMIWDVWKKKGQPDLYSTALITDDPSPEVKAAGHDRTPIFLKESAIDAWLNAKGSGDEIKEKYLAEREKPYYEHQVIGAA